MSVSLDHVILAARSGGASLAAELCGYIVLGAADQVVRAPCQLLTSGVELGSEGEVRIFPDRAAEEIAAEGSLRRLLSQLLEAARSGSPALERASRRPVGHGVMAFVGEIEAALVPVNRGAARRALARLHREAMRARLPTVPDPAASLPLSTRSAQVEARTADRAQVPDDQPVRQQHVLSGGELVVPLANADQQLSAPLQPSSLAPAEAEPPLSEQTDPMETGYGSLPRTEHIRLTHESRHREQDERTPKLGSIAVHAPRGEHDGLERLSWSGGAIHVDVDDLGDETPLLRRPELGSRALPAVELEAAGRVQSDEGDGPEIAHSQSVLSAAPASCPAAPATAERSATGCAVPPTRLETLVEGFAAADCRSVRELCRELQEIAGVEGREGQSSLPPPATKEKAP